MTTGAGSINNSWAFLFALGLAGCVSRAPFDVRPFNKAKREGVSTCYIFALEVLRRACGDWSRVTGPTPTTYHGTTAVFLDPPYADTAKRDGGIYRIDSLTLAHDVRKWAVEHGENPQMRIALCGYEGEHEMPDSWECVPWKAQGGMSSMRKNGVNENRFKERIWFSPHCLKEK